MTLRSARTEFLLGVALEIDNLQRRALHLKKLVDEAVATTPETKTRSMAVGTQHPPITGDELVARETIRTRVLNLQTTLREALASLEALVGKT
jgi:hypothetical protein